MTIAENIETTRMSLSSPKKSPGDSEKKQSRMKFRTSEPAPQNQEKTVKFKAKKEKPKVSKQRHDSVDDDDEDDEKEEGEPKKKTEEKPPLEFKNVLNDKR